MSLPPGATRDHRNLFVRLPVPNQQQSTSMPSSEPTQPSAPPPHPRMGCTCVDCGCCASASEGGEGASSYPFAMYRNRDNESQFMGMVQVDDSFNLKKLDEPWGSLDGPGHVMNDMEFFSECAHYDGADDPSRGSGRIKARIKTTLMINFAEHPHPDRFTDSGDDQFDVKYPFDKNNRGDYSNPGEEGIPQVRANDQVKVVAVGRMVDPVTGEEQTYMERFRVQVLSVTIFGTVTGICLSTLNYPRHPRIYEDDLLAFPVTCVLGVVHGPFWKHPNKCAACGESPDDLKACSGCRRAYYCSQTCQKKHRKQHKVTCDHYLLKIGQREG